MTTYRVHGKTVVLADNIVRRGIVNVRGNGVAQVGIAGKTIGYITLEGSTSGICFELGLILQTRLSKVVDFIKVLPDSSDSWRLPIATNVFCGEKSSPEMDSPAGNIRMFHLLRRDDVDPYFDQMLYFRLR